MGHTVQERSITLSAEMYALAKSTAMKEDRSISDQVEFWAMLGRSAVDNPDLPAEFVRDILISKAQDYASAEPFKPE